MILRLAGGDLNALLGGLGFVLGILAGVFFLKKGYSLKRSYSMARLEGFRSRPSRWWCYPAGGGSRLHLLHEAGGGPGAKHAAVLTAWRRA